MGHNNQIITSTGEVDADTPKVTGTTVGSSHALDVNAIGKFFLPPHDLIDHFIESDFDVWQYSLSGVVFAAVTVKYLTSSKLQIEKVFSTIFFGDLVLDDTLEFLTDGAGDYLYSASGEFLYI